MLYAGHEVHEFIPFIHLLIISSVLSWNIFFEELVFGLHIFYDIINETLYMKVFKVPYVMRVGGKKKNHWRIWKNEM